ncbi:MAG TPA: FCD domain-containing protein [Ramlibacter sp.]|nr:FCD domain-containing protein [Ramlibacter sp.]
MKATDTIADGPAEAASGTRADWVYRRLAADILSGRLAPGTKLAFHLLTDHYGVSVSTAREALQRLAGEQLVVGEGHRGFRVAPLSAAELADINGLRLLLEPRALRDSIQHGDAAWEERVLLASHRLARLQRPEDLRSVEADVWEQHHRDFHDALLSACGSPWTLQFCRTLYDRFTRYRRLLVSQYVTSPRLRAGVGAEHKSLLQAALGRDADRAVAVLVQHYGNTARRVLAHYEPARTGEVGVKARRRTS